MLTTLIQSLYAWHTRHPNAVSLLIGLGSVAVFGILALAAAVAHKHPARTVRAVTETNLGGPSSPTVPPGPKASGVIGLAAATEVGAAEISIANGPAVMCNYQLTTQGDGRQELESTFPVVLLKVFPPTIAQFVRSDLPADLKTPDGTLTVAMDGNKIILSGRGSRIPVELLALSDIPYPPKPEHAGELRPKEVRLFTVQDARFAACPESTYRNVLRVVLTNSSPDDVVVWSPLWEDTTGEVSAQLPFSSTLEQPILGYPRGEGDLEAWHGPADSLSVKAGQTVRCSIGLLEPQGEGIRRRLEIRRTGTLLLPIKINGELAAQRIVI